MVNEVEITKISEILGITSRPLIEVENYKDLAEILPYKTISTLAKFYKKTLPTVYFIPKILTNIHLK